MNVKLVMLQITNCDPDLSHPGPFGSFNCRLDYGRTTSLPWKHNHSKLVHLLVRLQIKYFMVGILQL